MNKRKSAALVLTLGLLASCQPGTGAAPYDDDTTFNGTKYYETVETRAKFDRQFERNIDEHLEGGHLNDAYWNTLEGVWQNDSSTRPHNGMNNRNLFYVEDGDETYLGFRGRGLYSRDADLRRTEDGQAYPEGAGIISKEKLVPGRYEIEMAAFPRYGGISACWTYLTETGNEATDQNEIDIEIGGHTDGETFKYFWATSWTTHSNKQTVDVDVSKILYLNDGNFHKYTFDWYTDYLDTDLGRVDWFIDGILVASVRGSLVTDKEMPLWIGLWFPAWTNNAVFDTDYMLMKSFTFTAFDETQYYNETRTNAGYTQTTPSEANIKTLPYSEVLNLNKLSNGDFETWDEVPLDGTHYGWEVPSSNKGEVKTVGLNGNQALALTSGEGRAYTRQKLEETYEGFKYDYSFDARLSDATSKGKVEIHYVSKLGKDIADPLVIDIEGAEMKKYKGSIVIPEKTRNLEFRIYGESGTTYVDNASMVYVR